MRRTSHHSTATIVAALISTTLAWQHLQVVTPTTRRTGTRLNVASKESDMTVAVPYVVARGDGSTGGGGLPMPKEEDGLKRPKVGAEMPHGRPSWFKVPAPSQGTQVVGVPRFLCTLFVSDDFLTHALDFLFFSIRLALPTGQGIAARSQASHCL
jgi:hypothetical protein